MKLKTTNCPTCNKITEHAYIQKKDKLERPYEKGFCGECGTVRAISLDNPNELTLWFGKHKGKKLSEIPVDYLEWALKEMKTLNDNQRTAMLEVVERAKGA